jgi:phenylalanyl-tRNA synthetase alpha chain
MNKIIIKWNDGKWKENLTKKLENPNLSHQEKAYYNRIIRVLEMPNLCEKIWNPIQIILENILLAPFFQGFAHIEIPEIVSEWETFDIFNFDENHIARRPSDSYFLEKSEIKKDSILLRPHTSVMWYYYLVEGKAKEILEKEGEVKALSRGKVYRVDEFDKMHHECFHQIDWLRIVAKEKEIIDQNTLKEILKNTIQALFWENTKFRFNQDTFPYTTDSLEVEVEYKWKWIEVTGAGIVHPSVLEKLGIDSKKYNGWAFGFWIERLAMALKQIPDIRIFWSDDKRILSQWGNLEPYKNISNFPPIYKDISFFTTKDKFIQDEPESRKSGKIELINESDSFDIAGIAREIWGWLIEEVRVIDVFENDKKFWNDKKSVCVKITFRSLEKTLTNDEINITYFQIREKLEKELWYELR